MGQKNSTSAKAAKSVNKNAPKVATTATKAVLRQQLETLADVSANLSPKSLTSVMETAAHMAGRKLSIDGERLRAELSNSAVDATSASSSVSENPQLPVQLSVALWEKLAKTGACDFGLRAHATESNANVSTPKQSDLAARNVQPANLEQHSNANDEDFEVKQRDLTPRNVKSANLEQHSNKTVNSTDFINGEDIQVKQGDLTATNIQPTNLEQHKTVNSTDLSDTMQRFSNAEHIQVKQDDPPSLLSSADNSNNKPVQICANDSDAIVKQSVGVEVPLSSSEINDTVNTNSIAKSEVSTSVAVETRAVLVTMPMPELPSDTHSEANGADKTTEDTQTQDKSSSLFTYIKYLLGYEQHSTDSSSTAPPALSDSATALQLTDKQNQADIATQSQAPDSVKDQHTIDEVPAMSPVPQPEPAAHIEDITPNYVLVANVPAIVIVNADDTAADVAQSRCPVTPNLLQQAISAMASGKRSNQPRKKSASEVHTSTPYVRSPLLGDGQRTPRNTFLPSKSGPTFEHVTRNSGNCPSLTKGTAKSALQPRNLLSTSSPFKTPDGHLHGCCLSTHKLEPMDEEMTPKQQCNHRQLVAVGCHKQNWTPRLGQAISPFASPKPACSCQRSAKTPSSTRKHPSSSAKRRVRNNSPQVTPRRLNAITTTR